MPSELDQRTTEKLAFQPWSEKITREQILAGIKEVVTFKESLPVFIQILKAIRRVDPIYGNHISHANIFVSLPDILYDLTSFCDLKIEKSKVFGVLNVMRDLVKMTNPLASLVTSRPEDLPRVETQVMDLIQNNWLPKASLPEEEARLIVNWILAVTRDWYQKGQWRKTPKENHTANKTKSRLFQVVRKAGLEKTIIAVQHLKNSRDQLVLLRALGYVYPNMSLRNFCQLKQIQFVTYQKSLSAAIRILESAITKFSGKTDDGSLPSLTIAQLANQIETVSLARSQKQLLPLNSYQETIAQKLTQSQNQKALLVLLTDQEKKVLFLAIEHHDNQYTYSITQIAQQLDLSKTAVYKILKNIRTVWQNGEPRFIGNDGRLVGQTLSNLLIAISKLQYQAVFVLTSDERKMIEYVVQQDSDGHHHTLDQVLSQFQLPSAKPLVKLEKNIWLAISGQHPIGTLKNQVGQAAVNT